MIGFLNSASKVRPSQRQLDWYDTAFYAFIHFGVNTFTDREWGDGTEPETVFAPTALDCDQWVESIKEAGMKAMILTAKHHDGFCLWPSKYTEHSVKNSPGAIDVVKEAAEACKRGGIKFGIYLSPWDRNNRLYGTPEYNNYYCNQLTELLTEYGDIFCVWLDGACGEGPNGKKQEYDFERYIALVRKYQPGAVIFYDHGPDVRWCGNEAGNPRRAEWAVVPSELCYYSEKQTGEGPLANEGDLEYLYSTEKELGCMSSILYSKGLVFAPAEVDTSIRPGWFWHEKEGPRALEELFNVYIGSVGGNACLNLNIPPTREGKIDERDRQRLRELRAMIDKEFAHEIPITVEKLDNGYETQPKYLVKFNEPVRDFQYVELRENIVTGQKVESFHVEAGIQGGNRFPLYQGDTIGNRKICMLTDPFADQNPLIDDRGEPIDRLIINITAARGEVDLKSIKVFARN